MVISMEDIRRDWLGEGDLSASEADVLAAFARVEAVLGADWLASRRRPNTVGPGIALPILEIGEQLRILERARNRESLMRRLRDNTASALAELTALVVCAGSDGDIDIEIEPIVSVGDGERVPDFRVRRLNEGWVHVEVTQPTMSDPQIEVMNAGKELAQSLMAIVPNGWMVEVRARRDVALDDLASVADAARNAQADSEQDLGWAVVTIERHTGIITPHGADELARPIMGTALGEIGPAMSRSVVVRIPFTDERARRILDAEAKQLPKAGPNLVCMVNSMQPGWVPLIERSFSPAIRTRVSGVLLLNGGIVLGENGFLREAAWGRLVVNPHAKATLPSWLRARLGSLATGP